MKYFILIFLCFRLATAGTLTYGYKSPCPTAFRCAIYEDKEDIVNDLINNDSEILNEEVNGELPIHFAARNKKESMIRLLINRRPDMVDVKNVNGYTPLFLAIAPHGNENLIKYLISRGANINARDKYQQTPLHACATFGTDYIARILLENGANVNARDDLGYTPLHWSSRLGKDIVAKLLIEHNADVNAKDANRKTPLHLATEYGRKDMVALLVRNNADINARDNDNKTACDIVREWSLWALVSILDCTLPNYGYDNRYVWRPNDPYVSNRNY